MDTARRMAKMYINEIMSGRYDPMPNPSAFPNYIEGGYEGMLVVRSELTSLCSHHHQTVKGVAYIGIIAGPKLLGLSKYSRIAQWVARRGTLQEDLNVMIANKIQEETLNHTKRLIIKAVELSNCKNVVISGGYALNCLNNYQLFHFFGATLFALFTSLMFIKVSAALSL